MKKILKLAIVPQKHNSMYLMFVVSISVSFVFIELIATPLIIDAINTIDHTLAIWMSALVIIIAFFSFIYYRYLCAYTFDEKIRDYGIIISLGMKREAIKKSFIWILAKLKFKALFYGLIAGTLIYYIILNLLNCKLNTNYNKLPNQGYGIIGIVYLIIFIVNALSLNRKINNMDVVDMLNYKKKEKKLPNPILYQNIGFGLLILGIMTLVFSGNKNFTVFLALLPMICFSVSAYLLTLSFSHWYTKLLTVSKGKYLDNLFYISQLRTNYQKYAKLLTTCTIIIIFGLFMTIMDINFITSSSSNGYDMPFDFIAYGNNSDNKTISKIKKFEEDHNDLISSAYLVNITDGYIMWDSDEYNRPIHVIPERTYRSLSGKSLNIKQDEIIVLSQIDRNQYNVGTQFYNGVEWGFQPLGNVQFKIADIIYQGEITKEIWEVIYNIDNQNQRTYIISNFNYDEIIDSLGSAQWKYFVSVSDSKYSAIIYEQLQNICPMIESKEEKIGKQIESSFIVSFIVLLVVALFLFLLINLIFLRISQNMNEEREKYSNLFSIGYTYKQLQDEIKKEMSTLFFLPVIIGGVFTICYTIFSSIKADLQLVIISLAAILLFSGIEYIFYIVTIKKLTKLYINKYYI